MKCFKHLTRGGKAVLLSVMVALAAGTAFAQSVENRASDGIFKNDADYFLSTTKWNNLQFNKAYIEATLNGGYVDAGTAFKIGNLYTAWCFTGEIIDDSDGWLFSKASKNEKADSDISEITAHDLYETYVEKSLAERYVIPWTPSNHFSALIGFANMGISLGYSGYGVARTGTFTTSNGNLSGNFNGTLADSKTKTFSNGESTASYQTVEYGNGKYNEYKEYIPSVGFGINLGKIRPYITVPVAFVDDSKSFSRTTTDIEAGVVKNVLFESKETPAGSYVGIFPTIGTEIDVKNGYLHVSYQPDIRLYGDAATTSTTINTVYTALSNNKTVTTTVTKSDLRSQNEFRNYLNCEYYFTKDVAEKVTLGGRAGLSLDVGFGKTVEKAGNYTETTNEYFVNKDGSANTTKKTTYTEGGETTTDWFDLGAAPSFTGSVKYAATDKVSLIFSASVELDTNMRTTTETVNPYSTSVTKYTDSLSGEDSVVKTNNFASPVSESKSSEYNYNSYYDASFGAVFTPTEAFDVGIYLNLQSLGGSSPFAGCIVQAQVRF